ncbi:MAG: flagellar motor switch protein FliG [Thermodesulfovibrionales bacterium]|nr:flagellar motor switch protein FliG [Thermodesulfovibrionales bacterium]
MKNSKLDGYEKTAIFLNLVGEDIAAEILKSLDIQDIGKITMQMTKLKSVPADVVDSLIEEVTQSVSSSTLNLGGEDFIKRVLYKGLGEDGASKILEIATQESPLEDLKWVDSKTLISFLSSEHPQTIALIMCLLEPSQAAEVLSGLPEHLKSEIVMRIANTGRISDNALDDIKEVLKGQLDLSKGKSKKLGGIKFAAEMLNLTDKATEKLVLEKIDEQNIELGDSIRQLMFVFEDIVTIDNRGIQMILKEISTEDLSIALKTASEELKNKIFANMSQRAAVILKEEMQAKGPVRVSDVEKAQMNIVNVVRKLEAEGKIIIAKRGGEELV